jgi:hypothetical protein
MAVYMAQTNRGGPVTLGFSGHPERRVRQLASELKLPLRLIATADGNHCLERTIKRRLASYRITVGVIGGSREFYLPSKAVAIEASQLGGLVIEDGLTYTVDGGVALVDGALLLRSHLADLGVGHIVAAIGAGLEHSTMRAMLGGWYFPDVHTAQAVELWSGGAVPAPSWLRFQSVQFFSGHPTIQSKVSRMKAASNVERLRGLQTATP